MKDQLISLEVGKLAKEKGFVGTNMTTDYIPMYIEGILNEGQGEDDCREGYCLAVTQSLLQKWLREVHKIFVQVEVDMTIEPKYCYTVFKYTPFYKNEPFYEYPLNRIYSDLYYTYEKALEAGLLETLKLIK